MRLWTCYITHTHKHKHKHKHKHTHTHTQTYMHTRHSYLSFPLAGVDYKIFTVLRVRRLSMSRRHFPTSCVAVHICIIRPFRAISSRLVLGYVPSCSFLCLHAWVLAGWCAGEGGNEDLQCECGWFDTGQDYFYIRFRVEANFRARQHNL